MAMTSICDPLSTTTAAMHQELPSYFANSTACFTHFDQDQDKALNYPEFVALAVLLFQNAAGHSYKMEDALIRTIFGVFNSSGSGLLNETEFDYCWNAWIDKILHPVSAHIVIDVQNDFIDGSLAVRNAPAGEEGAEVIEPINKLNSEVKWAQVYFSQDWHPPNHISFVNNTGLRPLHSSSPVQDPNEANVMDTAIFEGNPPIEQVLWPPHCIQGSEGAKLHPKLYVPPGSSIVYKGTNPDIDSYSAFWDNGKLAETNLRSELETHGITDVYVSGLAWDFCVGLTTLHSIELGYRTVLVEDAVRALDKKRKEEMRKRILEAGGIFVQSKGVKKMVEGVDRRPELGLRLALALAKKNGKE